MSELREGGEAMSMLGEQIKELREKADMLDGLEGMDNLVWMLREAADTIEKLVPHSDQLEPSRWHELFGTPERAARTLYGIKCGEKSCKGCPIAEPCAECDVMHDDGESLRAALLEWLRGDA